MGIRPKDDSNKLQVPTPGGGTENIQQTAPSQARRTLGVWQAPDGNEEEQTKQLTQKAKTWSNNIRKGFLSREDVAFGVQTSLYPSITYGLMATAMTETQCRQIFKPVRANVLAPMGYNRHMPAIVVHGPVKYGGMGIKDLYTIQGIEHVKALMDETTSTSPTASLLQILHDGHVLEIGRKGFLYDWDYEQVEHLMTDTWAKTTLKFISESEIKIEGSQNELEMWREGDACLMDEFAAVPGDRITRDDMIRVNRCRQYLQVVTRSDIAIGNGSGILRAAWRVEKHWESCSSMAYRWPDQRRPSIRDIKAWQTALTTTYGVDSQHLGWARTLGPLTENAMKYTSWWMTKDGEHLYHQMEGRWKRWTKMVRRVRTAGYTPTNEIYDAIDTDTYPAVVTRPPQRNTAYLEGYDCVCGTWT